MKGVVKKRRAGTYRKKKARKKGLGKELKGAIQHKKGDMLNEGRRNNDAPFPAAR
ncbi:hypothetical protein GCM10027189_14230 [Rufibacter soli]